MKIILAISLLLSFSAGAIEFYHGGENYDSHIGVPSGMGLIITLAFLAFVVYVALRVRKALREDKE